MIVLIGFLIVLALITAGLVALTERVDRPRRRLERAALLAARQPRTAV